MDGGDDCFPDQFVEQSLRVVLRNFDVLDSAVLLWPISAGGETTVTEMVNTYSGQDGSLNTDAVWTSGTWTDGWALTDYGTDDRE